MRFHNLILCGISFLLVACAQITGSNTPTSTTSLPDPHKHVVDVNGVGLVSEMSATFKIAEVLIDATAKADNFAINQNNTLRAFSRCDQTCRIFVEDLGTSQIREIQGISLPWRPFSDLVWITNDVLVFDQWTQPYYGIHYAVDVNAKKLILASPFTDQAP